MACMEWHCQKCNWYKMDNNTYAYCPCCGSFHVVSHFDEYPSPDIWATEEEEMYDD